MDSIKFNKCIGDNPSLCEESFEPGVKINMEAFEVAISLPGQNYFDNKIEDFAFLIAGELAVSKGYSCFIQKSRYFTSSCAEVYGVDTYGQLVGNYYYGTSSINRDTICASRYLTSFLLFNNYEDIKKGVLVPVQSANKFVLSGDLYFDVIRYDEKLNSGDKKKAEWFMWHTLDSWKSYYQAKDIVFSIRKKYNINHAIKLKINDAELQNSKTIQDIYKISPSQ